MRLRLPFLPFLLCLPFWAGAADVQFPLSHWCSPATATNRSVIIIPISLIPPIGVLPAYDRVRCTSDTNGIFWLSNMFAGTYTAEILAPPDATRFWFYVDTSNAVQNAASNLIVPTNAVPNGPDRYAYSATASDARYAPIILTPAAAPSAALINATGVGTNHLLRSVSGALMDYWSDGTNLYSKQLAP